MKTSIAVVGMGCIFPDAINLSEYWSNIVAGRDSIREIPDNYWLLEDYYDTDKSKSDKTYSKKAGIVNDISFNPLEFGIMPRDLESISVEQIFALVVAKQALTDAGLYGENANEFNRDKVGVILAAGIGKNAFSLNTRLQIPKFRKILLNSGVSAKLTEIVLKRIADAETEWTDNSNPGYLPNVVAGRVASRFNLYGTNCTVDAACASSLAALKCAVNELENGDSDIMLTGGVNLDCSEFSFVSFCKTPAISPSDRVRPFDIDSDGMVLGDGVGMLVLKRLEDAQRDRDKIYGVIKGIGSSGDGRAKGIFAPSVEGQVKALERAYKNTNINPGTITMIEAHGTGTRVGDNYELEALKKFLNNYEVNSEIGIGSVKSQIGHTRLSAGIASLIKVLLALDQKIQPGTLNVENPSNVIEDSSIKVIRNTKPWITNKLAPVRRAGVSAFGFGGTNFHVVVEEWKGEHKNPYRIKDIVKHIVFNGKTMEILLEKCKLLRQQLISEPNTDVNQLYGAVEVPQTDQRIGFVFTSVEDAVNKLSIAINQLNHRTVTESWKRDGIYYRVNGIGKNEKIATIFWKPNIQNINMLNDIAISYPEMRESFRKADNIRIDYQEKPISQIVYPCEAAEKEQSEELDKLEVSLLATGAAMSGFHKIFKNRGFKSDFYIGLNAMKSELLFAGGVIKEKECLKDIRESGIKLLRKNSDVSKKKKNQINIVESGTVVYESSKRKKCSGMKERASKRDLFHYRKKLEDCIRFANRKGASVFLNFGAETELLDKIKLNLENQNLEIISINIGSCENTLEQMETAFMQLRVLGLCIAKDKYAQDSKREKEDLGKHIIYVNPRIYRSDKKEKLVHTAIYNKSSANESTEKQEVKKQEAEKQEAEKQEGYKRTAAYTEPVPQQEAEKPKNKVILKKSRGIWQNRELQSVNKDAFIQFLNSQKSDFNNVAKILTNSVTDEKNDLILKGISQIGDKKLYGFKNYLKKQNTVCSDIINNSDEIKAGSTVCTEVKSGMRTLQISLKEAKVENGNHELKKGLAIIASDRDGVALQVCRKLEKLGYTAVLLDLEGIGCEESIYPVFHMDSMHESSIKACFEQICKSYELALTGFMYVSSTPQIEDSMQKGFDINRAIFLIAKYFYLYSNSNVKENERKFFVNVIRMDGKLGTSGNGENLVTAGLFGLSKSLSDEWRKDTIVKTIDISCSCKPEIATKYVMEELLSCNSLYPEIGRSKSGRRYFIGLKEKEKTGEAKELPGKEDVFLVSGGGRGITARCVIRLAEKYHCKFVLLGRTCLKDDVKWLYECKNEREIQAALITQMRERNIVCKPKEISAMVKSYYAQLMIQDTVEKLEKAGSEVLYYACDVTNESEVKNVIDDAVLKFGHITGFIHGAGILADKYIQDKTENDFDLVGGTKIFGLNACLNSVNMDKMKFIILFSSIAAFFGNKGQSDYAMANEVLNKMSWLLKNSYPSCKTVAINWGPWDGGMIDKSLKKALASRDISVIPIDKGIDLFMEQFEYEQKEYQAQVVVYDKMYF